MAKKPTKAAGGKKKSPAKSPAGAPMVNTALAASAAAALVGHKVSLVAPASQGPKTESASFKQLKESIAKPHAQGLASILESTSTQKKTNVPFEHGGKQVGHNQTYGADLTRSGVPRRTAG